MPVRTALASCLVMIVAGASTAAQEPSKSHSDRLAAMIGQMFLLEFKLDADRYTASKGGNPDAAIADMLTLVEEFNLGGFVLEEKNDDVYLDRRLAAVRGATAIDGLHPFIAVNAEGGPVQIGEYWYDHQAEWIGCTGLGPIPDYHAENPAPATTWTCPDHSWSVDVRYFPFVRNAHLMARMLTPAETETHATDVGAALMRLNVTMNLAPVLGVSDGTTKTSFLSDRTFADDPATVETWARAFTRGIRVGSDGGVVSVVKHFPGLGTVLDNTDDQAARSAPLAELERRDLLPYQEPIGRYYGASGVMMSNAIVPGLTCPVDDLACSVPATLSPAAYALLRDRYRWDGLIMTDTLQTKAIIGSGRTLGEAVVSAIAAGTDMAMFKPAGDDLSLDDYRGALSEARNAMLGWVAEDPTVRAAQIAASVERIDTTKASIAD